MGYVTLILISIAVIQVIIASFHGWNGREDKDIHYLVQAIITLVILILIAVSQ